MDAQSAYRTEAVGQRDQYLDRFGRLDQIFYAGPPCGAMPGDDR